MALKDFGGSPYAPPAPPPPVPVQRPAPAPVIKTNSKGNYAKPAAPPPSQAGPVVPSLDSYLNQDTGYQQQLRDFALSLNNFNADVTRRQGSLTTQYGLSQKALQDQREKDLLALQDDYGARGLQRSGLYGKAVGDYESEFGTRMTDLDRQQQDALAALNQESSQFNSTEQLKTQAAKEAAIRRRAESFGV
jgi:hypothetical protein